MSNIVGNFYEVGNRVNTTGQSYAPVNTDNPFGAYIGAEYINRQRAIVATNFFCFAPVELQTYYWQIVKPNVDWYIGNVPGIHNQGIFSTKTASKICKMSAQLTMSGSYRFDGEELESKVLSSFNKHHRIEDKIKAMLPMHNAIGFTLAKVDATSDGQLDINFVSGNAYFAQTDPNGDVFEVISVVRELTDSIDRQDNKIGYWLVEERMWLTVKGIDVPCNRYRVYSGTQISTAPVHGETPGRRILNYEQLQPAMRVKIDELIGDIKLDVWRELPKSYNGLGARIIKNTFAATGMEQYGGYSDSTINDIHVALYQLDWTTTLKNVHKYIAKDFVAMPAGFIDTMYKSGIGGENALGWVMGIRSSNSQNYNSQIVKWQDGADPNTQVPFVYQPTLHIAEYNAEIDHLYSEIASGAQFSPATVANFLKGDSVKTATQVRVEEGATETTVSDKRDLLISALNPLFEIVLRHYGFSGKSSMIFNNRGVSDKKGDLELVKLKLEMGVIDKKQAIQEANPQFSQSEVESTKQAIDSETVYVSDMNFGEYE